LLVNTVIEFVYSFNMEYMSSQTCTTCIYLKVANRGGAYASLHIADVHANYCRDEL
jgi:hypothetical protein